MNQKFKVLFFSVAVIVSGCNNQPPAHQAGAVAVIDLDKVATAIGRDKVISDKVEQYARSEEERLRKLREELRDEFTTARDKLGKSPSQEELATLNQQRTQSDNRLRQEITGAQQAAEKMRTELVMEFRVEVEPAARRIAQERGMDLVMIKQPIFLFADPDTDITDAVIDALQTSTASSPAATPTALE